MEIDYILERLYSYYKVVDNKQLAEMMGIEPFNITNWKSRNSINAIKKKCRELGIYNEIFGESNVSITQDKEGRAAAEDKIPAEHAEKETKEIRNNYINEQNINIKLFQFPRRSLVYFYYLIANENINNSIDYFAWMEKKEKTNFFINFMSDFIKEGNRLSLSAYRVETNEFISLFITNDELDYIFKNKVTFVKSVKSMIDKK